jgi:hypothetical protein
MLTPIMLQCHARSGSTVFMLILSCADGVYFSNEYPFEERDLTYVVRLVNLATKPIDKTLRNGFLSPYLDALRGYPYHGAGDFFDATDEARKNLFLTLWEGYSASARKKGDYKYYAEKVAFDIPQQVNRYIGAKNISLLRDPRAVFNSILEFDEKRGYYAFGRQEGETVTDFAERFCLGQKALMRHFSSVEPSENQLKLRYEDLIQNLPSTVRAIEAFLGCSIDKDRLKREFAAYSGLHATSPTAVASVDAWRTKLPDEVKVLLTERMGEELALLGYA